MIQNKIIFDKIKMDKVGRILLPKKVRKELNIKPTDYLYIEVIEKLIMLTKVNKYCVACGSETDLIKIKLTYLCSKCIDEVRPTTYIIL